MEWYEKEDQWERTLSAGRQVKDIWKYIPSRLIDAVNETEIDIDGYWVYLADGYVAYDGGEDCTTIHEYNVSDLKAAIKTIRKENKQ